MCRDVASGCIRRVEACGYGLWSLARTAQTPGAAFLWSPPRHHLAVSHKFQPVLFHVLFPLGRWPYLEFRWLVSKSLKVIFVNF